MTPNRARKKHDTQLLSVILLLVILTSFFYLDNLWCYDIQYDNTEQGDILRNSI